MQARVSELRHNLTAYDGMHVALTDDGKFASAQDTAPRYTITLADLSRPSCRVPTCPSQLGGDLTVLAVVRCGAGKGAGASATR